MPRLWIALAAVFAVAGLAPAEPVRWSYTAEMSSYGGGSWDTQYPNLVLDSDGTRNGLYSSRLEARSGSGVGSQLVAAGRTIPDGPSFGPNDPTPGYTDEFNFHLTVTDQASGQKGETGFTGAVYERVELRQTAPWDPVLRLDQIYVRDPGIPPPLLAEATWRLGDSEYHVTLSPRSDPDGSAYIDADVQVTSAQTPEPATLTLAAVGLAGVVGVRRRQNRHSQPSVTPCIQ